jgi:hypothetical protein
VRGLSTRKVAPIARSFALASPRAPEIGGGRPACFADRVIPYGGTSAPCTGFPASHPLARLSILLSGLLLMTPQVRRTGTIPAAAYCPKERKPWHLMTRHRDHLGPRIPLTL